MQENMKHIHKIFNILKTLKQFSRLIYQNKGQAYNYKLVLINARKGRFLKTQIV